MSLDLDGGSVVHGEDDLLVKESLVEARLVTECKAKTIGTGSLMKYSSVLDHVAPAPLVPS